MIIVEKWPSVYVDMCFISWNNLMDAYTEGISKHQHYCLKKPINKKE
jgi:hypothetical protein